MRRNKIIWLFAVSLIFLIVGMVFKKSIETGICLSTEPSCINTFTHIGNALYYGMGALAIVFLILIFKSGAVSTWKKFARWYIPIATLIFIFYPNPGSGDFFSPYPEQIFQWLSGAYLFISALIIALSIRNSKLIPGN
jgi:hypothetical protein